MKRKLFSRLAISAHHTIYGLFNSFFNFFVSLIIVRVYSAELWGEFAQYQFALIFALLFVDWGQKEFLIKKFSHGAGMSLWITSVGTRSILLLVALPALILIFDTTAGIVMFLWILSHAFHHSFDSLIVYTRKFSFPLFIEAASFVVAALVILLWKNDLQAIWLAGIFAISSLVKGLLLLAFFHKEIFTKSERLFKVSLMADAFPFFIPSLIGFLQAKSETLTVAIYLREEELGKYYLFMNMLYYCQLSVLMLFAPYKKNVYRFTPQVIRKMALKSLIVGIFWSAGGLFVIHLILTHVYLFILEPMHLVLGFLIVLPFFSYYLKLYHFFGRKPVYVTVTFSAAAILNFSLSLLLVPTYGVDGGLIANASGQWLCAVLFQYFIAYEMQKKNNLNEPSLQQAN